MSSQQNRPAPFKPGDEVVYTPSTRGFKIDVNFSGSARLEPGKTYRVKAIQDEAYVVVEGYDHPGGGLYWTEFTPR